MLTPAQARLLVEIAIKPEGKLEAYFLHGGVRAPAIKALLHAGYIVRRNEVLGPGMTGDRLVATPAGEAAAEQHIKRSRR